MRKLHSILLATDFRLAAEEAAKAAVQLISTFDSRVTGGRSSSGSWWESRPTT